jgi:hypothetical protein
MRHISRLQHSKCHVSIATVIHTTVEELSEVVFSVQSALAAA